MGEPGEPPEQEALWRFSLAFYALPEVGKALIALQNRRGLGEATRLGETHRVAHSRPARRRARQGGSWRR